MNKQFCIQLDKHTRIGADAYNYILLQETKERKKNPKTGKLEYTCKYTGNYSQECFFGKLEELIKWYAILRHRGTVCNNLRDTLKSLDDIFSEIWILGQGLDNKINNMMLKLEKENKKLSSEVKRLNKIIKEAKL